MEWFDEHTAQCRYWGKETIIINGVNFSASAQSLPILGVFNWELSSSGGGDYAVKNT